ncbi:hypothetical protein [Sporolactobacillus terrae]|uniref:hypothetical protein n=1 Tax=Sporolactobacillus terrae TaxID=269673 RepID=UPI00111A7625|nr:hypothetical protein [Sporolactobacillus terrae]
MDKKETKHKLLWIIIAIVVVLFVGGGGTGYYFYHQQQVAKAKAIAVAIEKRAKIIKQENKYDENFRNALGYLTTAFEDTKTVADGYVQIWNDAIFDPVGAIAGPDFTVTQDFNEAIALKTEDFKEDGSLDSMDEDNKILKEAMASLGEPPKKFTDVASKLSEAYGKFQTYYSLAETPSGSFNSYKSQTDGLKSEIDSATNDISVSIPKIPSK